MSDYIVIDGDHAVFMPNFGQAIVVVLPGKIQGSGDATLNAKNTCIEGDEASVSVAGCMYMTPQYSIPGSGSITIDALASDQLTEKTNTNATALILLGTQFEAKFSVQVPAQQPGSPPVPDSTPDYAGKGKFITTNTKFKGS
jgi:hypothetical protein